MQIPEEVWVGSIVNLKFEKFKAAIATNDKDALIKALTEDAVKDYSFDARINSAFIGMITIYALLLDGPGLKKICNDYITVASQNVKLTEEKSELEDKAVKIASLSIFAVLLIAFILPLAALLFVPAMFALPMVVLPFVAALLAAAIVLITVSLYRKHAKLIDKKMEDNLAQFKATAAGPVVAEDKTDLNLANAQPRSTLSLLRSRRPSPELDLNTEIEMSESVSASFAPSSPKA